jgi:hypothetical protein
VRRGPGGNPAQPGCTSGAPVQPPDHNQNSLMNRIFFISRRGIRRPGNMVWYTPATWFPPGLTGLCVGRLVWSRCDRSVHRLVRRRGRRRRLYAGKAQDSSSQRLSLPLDYKYSFTYLEMKRLPFKSYHCILSLSPPLMSSPS